LGAVGQFLIDLVSRRPQGSGDCDTGERSHLRLVLVGDPFEGPACSLRQTGPSAIEQLGKFGDSRLTDPGARTFERHAKIFWKGFRFDDGTADAIRDQEVTFGAIGP
jgi:hypothetical protein